MRWSSLLDDYETSEEASATVLAETFASFCHLQELVKISRETARSQDILSLAMFTDTELEKWAVAERHERPYSSIKQQLPSVLAFRGVYDIYHSVAIATCWNHYRSVRIMVNAIITAEFESRRGSQRFDSYFENDMLEHQSTASKPLINTLSEDICASVHYFLDIVGAAEPLIRLPAEKTVRAKLLLWHLYTAGNNVCIPDTTLSWIAGVFDLITRVTGIRELASLSKTMRAWPGGAHQRASPSAPWTEAVLKDRQDQRVSE